MAIDESLFAFRAALQDGDELMRMRFVSADGLTGRIERFCIEEDSWAVTRMIVVVRGTSGRRRFFVPVSAIAYIDRGGRRAYLQPGLVLEDIPGTG